MKDEAILDKVNAHRAKWGLNPTDAGFDYAMAINDIKKETGCTNADIGARIGVSGQHVGRILRGQIPNHVSGELLWGLWLDVFPRGGTEAKRLPITPAQKKGGAPDIP